MRVIAGEKVTEYVRENGGRLFVWPDPHRCLVGAYTYLDASTSPPKKKRPFNPVPHDDFELYFDPGALAPPTELHLEVKGRRRTKRVEAYWDGCIFVG
jgi:hypothetical protein